MRIAIVNDLALAREVLRRVVQSVPGGSVAWVAADGEEAVRLAAADRPDAILMDLVMPRIDGAEATRRIMKQSPCPILIVTSTVAGNFGLVYQAMGAGGLDAVDTPSLGPNGTVTNAGPIIDRLAKLQSALARSPAAPKFSPPTPSPDVKKSSSLNIATFPLVAIGASTGGPTALTHVLAQLPADLPAGMLVVQHIAAEFAVGLAAWLAARCKLKVDSAVNGDAPAVGRVLVATSNDHLELRSEGRVNYTPDPRDVPYRPSVDVLFSSLAANWTARGVAVLLTGMGDDGAEGLLRLRRNGWHTIAQDEGSCVVYGMPKAAAERNAAVEVLPLDAIAPAILASVLRLKRGG